MALSPAGLFSCSRLRGTQEAHVNTGCMWALAKVRGTCSGGSMSRKLANTEWIGLRPVRANQTHANTKTEAQFPPHSIFSFSRSPPHAIFSFFVSGCCCYGTTAALEAFPVLTATNGACMCTCGYVCAILLMNPQFSTDLKSTRAEHSSTQNQEQQQQQQQQRYGRKRR